MESPKLENPATSVPGTVAVGSIVGNKKSVSSSSPPRRLRPLPLWTARRPGGPKRNRRPGASVIGVTESYKNAGAIGGLIPFCN